MADSEHISFEWGTLSMTGTLRIPPLPAPHPAVLMMQGSGPADRDADGYFAPIRDAFLQRGIATYSFDKPGCGDSTGDWRDYGLEGRADQAAEAVAMLRSHSLLDSGRVGGWGQSQGGWLAQMVAGRDPDLAFAIANSGPSIGVIEQDLYGCEHSMRKEGHTEREIELALDLIRNLHSAAQQGASFEEVDRELLTDARGQSWYGYADVEDAADWAHGCLLVAEGYEPAEAMAVIRCPILAVYGGRDVLVPAWRSAEESGRALDQAGNPDATVVVFPSGDHRIRDEETGEFLAGYLDLLGDWASMRAHRNPHGG